MKKLLIVGLCLSITGIINADIKEFQRRLDIGDKLVADYKEFANDPKVSDAIKLAILQDAYRAYAYAWWLRKDSDVPKELVRKYETIIRANTNKLNALKEKLRKPKKAQIVDLKLLKAFRESAKTQKKQEWNKEQVKKEL